MSAKPAHQSKDSNASQLLFRPAAARFHSQLDWLDSWHSFSFADHYDPDWVGFGPLRVINDDTIGAGRGFGMHPHRDMEIVTVMVAGQIDHCDSMGHSQVLRAGELQWMSAGSGLQVAADLDRTQPGRPAAGLRAEALCHRPRLDATAGSHRCRRSTGDSAAGKTLARPARGWQVPGAAHQQRLPGLAAANRRQRQPAPK